MRQKSARLLHSRFTRLIAPYDEPSSRIPVPNLRHRSLSSKQQSSPAPPPATSTAEGELPRDTWRAGALSTPPRPIFPWRHDPNPLPRLVGDEARHGGLLGPGFPTFDSPFDAYMLSFIVMQSGAALLNVPWYRRLTSAWKQELADASGWAFSQAVAGVLSNTYRVPFDAIVGTDDSDEESSYVSFDHTTKFQTPEEESNPFPQADYMMDEKLIHLYEAAHDSGKEQMRILLQTRPISSRLVSLAIVPGLTRTAVVERPALRHTFRNIFARVTEKHADRVGGVGILDSIRLGKDLVTDLMRERVEFHPDGYGVLEHTLIAQVVVQCDEVFGVRDLLTDKMLQGDGLRRDVSHLVRLEMPIQSRMYSSQQGGNSFHHGSWMITDWDDLLDGNIWFI